MPAVSGALVTVALPPSEVAALQVDSVALLQDDPDESVSTGRHLPGVAVAVST